MNLLVMVQNKKNVIIEIQLLPQKFHCYRRISTVTAEVQLLPQKSSTVTAEKFNCYRRS
jgi:hypothetical protein